MGAKLKLPAVREIFINLQFLNFSFLNYQIATMKCIVVVVEETKDVKAVKNCLEGHKLISKSHKIKRENSEFWVFTGAKLLGDEVMKKLSQYKVKFEEYEDYEEDTSDRQSLNSVVKNYLQNTQFVNLMVPKKWLVYPPMVLFGSDSFNTDEWQNAFDTGLNKDELFVHILSLDVFGKSGLTHIAVNQPIICEDVMRRPFNIIPMYGDFGPAPKFDHPTQLDFSSAFWCSVLQNGIRQHWAPQYTMFSRGNIKEKARVLQFGGSRDSVVFDLYCGIGYFSLSYLKNGCANILCWELNPWSVEGFARSLRGKYSFKIFTRGDPFDYDLFTELLSTTKVFIFQESNEYVGERLDSFPLHSLPISHINLGLLPSSQDSWPTAKRLATHHAQKSCLPQVHIHENVHIKQFDEFQQLVGQEFGGTTTHVEKVKTFAPDVWHIVVDVTLNQ